MKRILVHIEPLLSLFMTNGAKTEKASQDPRLEQLTRYYTESSHDVVELRFHRWRVERNRSGFYSFSERQVHLLAIDRAIASRPSA